MKSNQIDRRNFLKGGIAALIGSGAFPFVNPASARAGLAAASVGPEASASQGLAVPYVVRPATIPVPYEEQALQGLLGERVDANFRQVLLRIPYDEYLRGYDRGVVAHWPAGEFLAKFLQGLQATYRYNHDDTALELMRTIVDRWFSAQAPDGYLATHPQEASAGERWLTQSWNVWEHKYEILGLLEYYPLTQDERALGAARRIGNLLVKTFGDGPGQRDLMKGYWTGMANGSILEPMTYLYQYTADPKYLAFCEYVLRAYEQPNGPKIVSELAQRSGRVDKVGSAKGYEMLSCLIGIVRMYQLTGNKEYLTAASNAADDITHHRLYVTGTATSAEIFRDNDYLPGEQDKKVGEVCVTAHWMILNELLYQITGDLKYVEEIEKSLYNHLLGSQKPSDASVSYYTPLLGSKHFSQPDCYGPEPPCCFASAARGVARIPELLWARFREGGLGILIYNTATLKTRIKSTTGENVATTVQIDTEYPKSGAVSVQVAPEKPTRFRLALRVPGWCNRFEARINGGASVKAEVASYLNLERVWGGHDTIEIRMSMNDRLVEGGANYPGQYAVLHGPQVLALDAELNLGRLEDAVLPGTTEVNLRPAQDKLPADWNGRQAYALAAARPKGAELLLVPFMDAGQHRSQYRVWIKT
jgi:DUF1680 family protein